MINDLLITLYPWIKAGHIASVISWMAAMFYLPRLFVYHTESVTSGSETDRLFQTMERKLYSVIMRPAMISTWVFGLLLAITPGVIDWGSFWPWIKLVAILGMTGFHGWLGGKRRGFEAAENSLSGRQYRMANEVPTVLMLVIVVIVIVKPF